MKIAPLFQMNQSGSTTPFKTISNSGSLRFSECLAVNHGIKQLPNIDQVGAFSEQLSIQQIMDGMKVLLSGVSFDNTGQNSSFYQEGQTATIQPSTVSMLENEISNSLNGSQSLVELIDQVKHSPAAVGALTLVKAIEDISIDEKIDFTPFIGKLNNVLDQEYSSYNNPESYSFSSMMKAIDQLNLNDKYLINGQILLRKWTSADHPSRLINIDKLFVIHNKLTDTKMIPLQEVQLKEDILNGLFDVPSTNENETSLQSIFEKADVATIKSIINKEVETLFANESLYSQLDLTRSQGHDMLFGVRNFPEENHFIIERKVGNETLTISQTEHKDLDKELKHLSREQALKKSTSEQSEKFTPIEIMFHILQSGHNQHTQRKGNDLSQVTKEITRFLNEYLGIDHNAFNQSLNPTVANKHIEMKENDFFIGINAYEKAKSLAETSVNSALNDKINELLKMEINSYFKTADLENTAPLITNLLSIAKIADHIAIERSVAVDDVLSEIEYLIRGQMKLRHDRQILHGSQYDIVNNEMKIPIASLIKGVQLLEKGTEFLPSELSIKVNELFSKVEARLQIEIFQFKKLAQKETLIENIPQLNDSMLIKKEDGQLTETFADRILYSNEMPTNKANVLFDGIQSAVYTKVPARKGSINKNIPHLNNNMLVKQEDGQLTGTIGDRMSISNKSPTNKVNVLFDDIQLSVDSKVPAKKGLINKNILQLNDSMVEIKQDSQLMGPMNKRMVNSNERFINKSNVLYEGIQSTVDRMNSVRQQMINGAFSQIQPEDGVKSVGIIEYTDTIQLDTFISKLPVIVGENSKPEFPIRQEFINQLINAFKASKFGQLPNGANRLLIKLNPEHLGSLTVRLVHKNGEMIARIITSTESAKDLLDHSIHQLKHALPSIQFEIERFEVHTDQALKTFKDHTSEQEEKHEDDYVHSSNEDENENEQSFIESLKEALNTTIYGG